MILRHFSKTDCFFDIQLSCLVNETHFLLGDQRVDIFYTITYILPFISYYAKSSVCVVFVLRYSSTFGLLFIYVFFSFFFSRLTVR